MQSNRISNNNHFLPPHFSEGNVYFSLRIGPLFVALISGTTLTLWSILFSLLCRR